MKVIEIPFLIELHLESLNECLNVENLSEDEKLNGRDDTSSIESVNVIIITDG
uniref:Uncharacterized protein n=1 Tax=Rhizophagus irregularis (strain DAOM 181602 / DAOM 197198 / MUCL 43194) TaxID=747089 RepID=U9TPR3_RHIID